MRNVLIPTLVMALALGAAMPAQAQRLFARLGADLYELHTTPDRLGRLAGVRSLASACPTPAVAYPLRTWSVLRGRYLAWDVPDGICVFDVLAGRGRYVITPSPQPPIVATSDTTFAIVMGLRAEVQILPSPDAAVVSRTIPRSYPFNLFSSQTWSYAIAPGSRRLVVVQGEGDFPTPARPALVTTLSLDTGAIERESSADVPLAANAVADGTGDRVVLFAGASTYPTVRTGGVVVVRTTDGVVESQVSGVVQSSPVLWPSYGATNDGTHRLLWHPDSGNVIGVTTQAAGPATVPLLTDVGAPDLPRLMVPPPPSFTSGLDFRLWVDAGSRQFVGMEHEGHSVSYHGGPCVRSTLTSIDAAGATRLADLAVTLGVRPCGYADAFFLISSPPAPADFAATVGGNVATFSWSAVAGATHYVIEAGSAPGLANLATLAVTGSSLTVPGVPPGTYYLRIRSVGVGGQGDRSTDIAVTVP